MIQYGLVAAQGTTAITAKCEDGDAVLSGGFQKFGADLGHSQPWWNTETGLWQGWEITVFNNTGEETIWNAYAFCVPLD